MPLSVGSLISALEESDVEKVCAEALRDETTIKFAIPDCRPITDKAVIDYANLLIYDALLKLPFEACYFEFQNIQTLYSNVKTVGILACCPPDGSGRVITRSFQRFVDDHEFEWRFDTYFSGWSVDKENPGWIRPQLFSTMYPDEPAPEDIDFFGQVSLLAAAVVAFMDLKESRLSNQRVTNSVAARRAADGKKEIYSHNILTLSPSVKRQYFTGISGIGAALVPRKAHWRRGHLRHLPGKIVPVAPALIRGEGFLSKDYKITA